MYRKSQFHDSNLEMKRWYCLPTLAIYYPSPTHFPIPACLKRRRVIGTPPPREKVKISMQKCPMISQVHFQQFSMLSIAYFFKHET